MGEGENYRAGTSPAGALAHEPCCHRKGGSFRVGLKDGGRGRDMFFFFLVFFLPLRLSRCPYMGSHSQELGSSTAIRIGMWLDRSTDNIILSRSQYESQECTGFSSSKTAPPLRQ